MNYKDIGRVAKKIKKEVPGVEIQVIYKYDYDSIDVEVKYKDDEGSCGFSGNTLDSCEESRLYGLIYNIIMNIEYETKNRERYIM